MKTATHQNQPNFSLKNSTKRNQILKSNILEYRGKIQIKTDHTPMMSHKQSFKWKMHIIDGVVSTVN